MLNIKNRKILIILGVIIFILIVFFGLVFFKDNNILKENFISRIVKEEIFTEKKPEKTIAEKKNDFEKEKLENPNKVVREIYPIEKENCDRIIEADLQKDCYDFLILDQIIEKQEITACASLEKSLRDSCLYQIIINREGGDFSTCSELNDLVLRDLCYQNGAIAQNKIKDCDLLENGQERCQEAVISAQSYYQGIQSCATLKIPQYFSFCVKNTQQACSEIGAEALVDQCETWRNFDYIIFQGNKDNCDIIPLEDFKKVCNSYFDNDKKYLDSDEDGINDWEELYFGFAPFSQDEGILEKIEQLKKETSPPNVYADYQAKLYRLMLDSDNDGLRDYEEALYGTDPNNPDTDGDGYLDGAEVKGSYDPLS